MPRLYHSASSDAAGQRCHRLWYYTYVLGLREPRIEWPDVAHYVSDRSADERGIYWWRDPAGKTPPITSRQRSTALGVAVHKKHEGWYKGEPVNWHDEPGAIALSGAHLLPSPGTVRARVEVPIGDAAIVGDTDPHAPPVGFRIAGVLWAGYRDLVVERDDDAEWARVLFPEWARVALIDHKSSSNIREYALLGDAQDASVNERSKLLLGDFAANLYGLATMTEYGLERLPAVWVYYETKRRRYAEQRATVITREGAFRIVEAGCRRSRALDSIRDEQDAEPNTDACDDYGGCPHHRRFGGPCTAEATLGFLLVNVRISKKESTPMALPPGIQARVAPPNGAVPPVAPVAPTLMQTAPPAPAAAPVEYAAPPQPVAPSPVEYVAPPAAAAPPPPPPEPAKKNTRKAAAAAPPPAPAPVGASGPIALGASASDDHDSFELPGQFGTLTLSGPSRAILAAVRILLNAPG